MNTARKTRRYVKCVKGKLNDMGCIQSILHAVEDLKGAEPAYGR